MASRAVAGRAGLGVNLDSSMTEPLPLTPVASPWAGARPGWRERAWARMWRLFWLKALGMSVFMTLFFMLYFHLLRHPVQPVQPMPLTALDAWLPYQAWAVWPYLSLWVYLGLAPMLMHRFADLLVYCLWNVLLCGLGLFIFWQWPTAVPAFSHPQASQWPNAILQGIDAAGNACPSLHVATALFCGLWANRVMREIGLPPGLRVAQALWLLLIIYSTLAIKQHVLWDVAGGVALALAVAWPSLRLQSAGRALS